LTNLSIEQSESHWQWYVVDSLIRTKVDAWERLGIEEQSRLYPTSIHT
jgi:hypothetical protein